MYPGATRRWLAWVGTEEGPEQVCSGIISIRDTCTLRQVDRRKQVRLERPETAPDPLISAKSHGYPLYSRLESVEAREANCVWIPTLIRSMRRSGNAVAGALD